MSDDIIEFVGIEDISVRYVDMFDPPPPPLQDDTFAYLLKVKINGISFSYVYRFAGDFVRIDGFLETAKSLAINKAKRHLTEHGL